MNQVRDLLMDTATGKQDDIYEKHIDIVEKLGKNCHLPGNYISW